MGLRSMIVSIGQPAYLPWLGYFQRIVRSDVHVVLDHVQFERHSNVNRNEILVNDRRHWLTVPVKTARLGLNIAICDLEIAYASNWPRKHLATIIQSYHGTPGLSDAVELISEPLNKRDRFLTELVADINARMFEYLNVTTPVVLSSSLGVKSANSQLVLEICQKMGASVYLSGGMGRNYLDLETFRSAGIEVEFHEFKPLPYTQRSDTFVPRLSALDAICNLGTEAIKAVR